MSKYGSGIGNNTRKKDHHELLLKATSRSLFLHNPTPKFLFYSSKNRSQSVGKIDYPDSDNDSASRMSEDVLNMDKKSSSRFKWKKPLKALSHMGRQRFNCSFFLHVRSIEGLPSTFNGISLCVHWKRKDKVLQTCSTRVIQGTADFDETLMQRCSVYAARSGQRWAKYGEKLSLVYVSVVGAPGIDLGKHWIDLTRTLPVTLEELSGEKSSGKWTTNLELHGRAEGAFLNVTFSFTALKDNTTLPNDSMNFSQSRDLTEKSSGIFERREPLYAKATNSTLKRVGSTPSSSDRIPLHSWSAELSPKWEVMQSPDSLLSYPVDSLYRKLKAGKVAKGASLSESDAEKEGDGFDAGYVNDFDSEKCEQIKFTVTEKGIETSSDEYLEANQDDDQLIDCSTAELLEVEEISKHNDTINEDEANCNWKNVICSDCEKKDVSECKKEYDEKINKEENCNLKNVLSGDPENDLSECKKVEESEIKEMESHHHSMSQVECAESKSSTATKEFFDQENTNEGKSNSNPISMNRKSLSPGYTDESIEKSWGVDDNAFSSSLEPDPESPRERLLREFEMEALVSGSFILDLYAGREPDGLPNWRDDPYGGDISESTTFLSGVQDSDEHDISSQLVGDGTKAAEDIEFGELAKVYLDPTYCCSTVPGSPTKQPESPIQTSSRGDFVGPVIWTKDGGILRSMHPKLFKNVKNATPLTIQVSRSIVLPAEMGSGIMDILQSFASVEIEKLSRQLEKLLPLEDIGGKSVQQIANRAAIKATVHEHHSLAKLPNESEVHKDNLHDIAAVQNSRVVQSDGAINLNSTLNNVDQEIVMPRSLASMIVETIEFLLIEGLKIQSGMANEKAPARINHHLSKITFPSRGRTAIFGRSTQPQGIAGVELLITDENRQLDHLLSMSLTLDKWMSYCASKIDNDDQFTDDTLELPTVHSDKCLGNIGGWQKIDMHRSSAWGRNHSFTIVVKVQLRDSSQTLEPVGIPMLILMQVERSSVSAPKVSCIAEEPSNSGGNSLEEEMYEEVLKEFNVGDFPAGFRITGINIAGLHTEDQKKELLGTAIWQQSGAHWLLASGIGKADKYQQLVESKPNVRSSEQIVQPQDILWSISSCTGSRENSTKELSTPSPHVRNPDIILPEAGIRVHAAGFF